MNRLSRAIARWLVSRHTLHEQLSVYERDINHLRLRNRMLEERDRSQVHRIERLEGQVLRLLRVDE